MRTIARLSRSAALVLLVVALTQPAPAAVPIPPSVPRAVCGPGSLPETGIQGRVTAADLAAGTGSHCNLELLGHQGTLAGFRTYRYVDAAGHECAFYDSTPYLQTRPNTAFMDPNITGVHIVDMHDPAHPRHTAELRTPAMRSPHESLSLNVRRGLLAADLGNLVAGPGFVDVYSVKKDCRHPKLLSSLPIGVLGHEGTFSPDGKTFWVTAGVGAYLSRNLGTMAAIDVSIPFAPRVLWTSTAYTAHGLNISADGKTLYFGDLSPKRGLTVLDVSQIQARKLDPKARVISRLTWATVSLPQTDIPVTIGSHPYLVEVDEFTHDTIKDTANHTSLSNPADFVGAARIIDIADITRPHVVSDIRLEVNQPSARAGAQANDPGANTATGYTAHYCAVPRANDPGIVACSFILSGLRVFDIHDPFHPKEIAYFNPPTTTGTPYSAMSAPAFVPERHEIWYTDANYGLFALTVTNGVW